MFIMVWCLLDLLESLEETLGTLTIMGFNLRVAFIKVKDVFQEICK